MKNILPIILFPLFCHFVATAQSKWYVSVQGGGKVSFSETGSSSFSYKPDIAVFSLDESNDAKAKSLTGQLGLRFGRVFGGKFKMETGLSLSGHVHNFKKSFGDKDLLGDKLSHRLVYYVFEAPLSLEYQLPVKFKGMSFAGFMGMKANFSGFRPYWGEYVPWSSENLPLIQTAYFLPNDPNRGRRYVSSFGGGKPFQYGAGSVFGGVSIYRHWKENKHIRVTVSYHSKTFNTWHYELLDVQTMEYDDFGVLILSEPLTTYSSYSAMENIAFDIGLVYFLEAKK